MLAAALTLSASCDTPSDPFTPFGSDADVYGEWDVNGALPSIAACEAAGIARVRVVFSASPTSEERIADESFTWNCAAGFFDSGTLGLLDAGVVTYRWQALADAGDVLLESRPYSVVVERNVEVVFMPVDFLRREDLLVSVSLTFAADSGFGSCATALVDTLRWSLHAGDAQGPLLAASAAGSTCIETFQIPESTLLSWSEGPATLVVEGTATDGSQWAAECPLSLPYGGPVGVVCEVPRAP